MHFANLPPTFFLLYKALSLNSLTATEKVITRGPAAFGLLPALILVDIKALKIYIRYLSSPICLRC